LLKVHNFNVILINAYKWSGHPDPPVPISVVAEAEATDISSRVIKGVTQFIVHPCEYYIGIRIPREYLACYL
jgi:hypothetical protein